MEKNKTIKDLEKTAKEQKSIGGKKKLEIITKMTNRNYNWHYGQSEPAKRRIDRKYFWQNKQPFEGDDYLFLWQ